jgi:hypothetical protein
MCLRPPATFLEVEAVVHLEFIWYCDCFYNYNKKKLILVNKFKKLILVIIVLNKICV